MSRVGSNPGPPTKIRIQSPALQLRISPLVGKTPHDAARLGLPPHRDLRIWAVETHASCTPGLVNVGT